MNGIRIRSKCDWFKSGERSSKCFLNLEKSKAVQSTIRNIAKDKKILVCHVKSRKLMKNVLNFIKPIFKKS